MGKNEPCNTDSIGSVRCQSGSSRTEEKRIRISESFEVDVPVCKTKSIPEANQEITCQISTHAYSDSEIKSVIYRGGHRLDGSILGAGSGLGLLHTGRRRYTIRRREVLGSDCGLSTL